MNTRSNNNIMMMKKYMKRKKTLSIMKKKILLERLRVHVESQANTNTINNNTNNNSTNYLCLLNFCTIEDISNDDDKNEIIENIKELVSPFSNCNTIDIITDTININECIVICLLDSYNSVNNAIKFLNNMVLGGIPIKACHHYNNNDNNNNDNNNDNNNHKNNNIIKSKDIKIILNLYNIIDNDYTNDDDEETQEILSDIEYLCANNDHIVNVWIEKRDNHSNNINDNDNNITTTTTTTNLPWCLMEFTLSSLSLSLSTVIDTITKLNGKIVGGLPLSVSLYDYNAYNMDIFSDNHIIDNDNDNGIITISLINFVDIEALNDNDEKDEIINNIQALVHEAVINDNNNNIIFFCIEKDNNNNDQCDALISCSSIVVALLLMKFFSVTTVAGVSIRTNLQVVKTNNKIITGSVIYKNDNNYNNITNIYNNDNNSIIIIIKNFLSFDDIDNANMDEVIQIKKDLLELCNINNDDNVIRRISIVKDGNNNDHSKSKFVGCVGFSNSNDAMESMLAIDGIIIGGNTIKAIMIQSCETNVNDNNLFATSTKSFNVDKITCDNDQDDVANKSDEEITSKYIKAKEAPSLEKHITPSTTGIPIATPEINVLIEQFLKAISTFQKRSDEKDRDSEKAGNENVVKKRKRYVMGIKQCTTTAKTGRAVLVVLAPNTETAQVIDDKLEILIQYCREKEIPIIYALNKRKLGKAIQATMKQAVVAVCQPDGCYDVFKKIIKFCEIYSE